MILRVGLGDFAKRQAQLGDDIGGRTKDLRAMSRFCSYEGSIRYVPQVKKNALLLKILALDVVNK